MFRQTYLPVLTLCLWALFSYAPAAQAQEVSTGLFGAMASRFDGQAGAFAYLLFILLYFPCVATIGAITRETGAAWAAFVATWTTGVAFTTSTIFYQTARFGEHPYSSSAWIVGLLAIVAGVVLVLRSWRRHGDDHHPVSSGAQA